MRVTRLSLYEINRLGLINLFGVIWSVENYLFMSASLQIL